jgi:hypothetical protein
MAGADLENVLSQNPYSQVNNDTFNKWIWSYLNRHHTDRDWENKKELAGQLRFARYDCKGDEETAERLRDLEVIFKKESSDTSRSCREQDDKCVFSPGQERTVDGSCELRLATTQDQKSRGGGELLLCHKKDMQQKKEPFRKSIYCEYKRVGAKQKCVSSHSVIKDRESLINCAPVRESHTEECAARGSRQKALLHQTKMASEDFEKFVRALDLHRDAKNWDDVKWPCKFDSGKCRLLRDNEELKQIDHEECTGAPMDGGLIDCFVKYPRSDAQTSQKERTRESVFFEGKKRIEKIMKPWTDRNERVIKFMEDQLDKSKLEKVKKHLVAKLIERFKHHGGKSLDDLRAHVVQRSDLATSLEEDWKELRSECGREIISLRRAVTTKVSQKNLEGIVTSYPTKSKGEALRSYLHEMSGSKALVQTSSPIKEFKIMKKVQSEEIGEVWIPAPFDQTQRLTTEADDVITKLNWSSCRSPKNYLSLLGLSFLLEDFKSAGFRQVLEKFQRHAWPKNARRLEMSISNTDTDSGCKKIILAIVMESSPDRLIKIPKFELDVTSAYVKLQDSWEMFKLNDTMFQSSNTRAPSCSSYLVISAERVMTNEEKVAENVFVDDWSHVVVPDGVKLLHIIQCIAAARARRRQEEIARMLTEIVKFGKDARTLVELCMETLISLEDKFKFSEETKPSFHHYPTGSLLKTLTLHKNGMNLAFLSPSARRTETENGDEEVSQHEKMLELSPETRVDGDRIPSVVVCATSSSSNLNFFAQVRAPGLDEPSWVELKQSRSALPTHAEPVERHEDYNALDSSIGDVVLSGDGFLQTYGTYKLQGEPLVVFLSSRTLPTTVQPLVSASANPETELLVRALLLSDVFGETSGLSESIRRTLFPRSTKI